MVNKKSLTFLIVIFLVFIFISLVSALNENNTFVTKQIALEFIDGSEQIIEDMQSNGFSTVYLGDILLESKRLFQQAEYASILRGEVNASENEKQEARIALRLVKWQNITYADVLVYYSDIQKIRETAYLILDKISVEESKLLEISNETKLLFEQAKLAFVEERYNDADKFLEDFKFLVEKEKQESSNLSGLQKGARNFFQRYWVYIISGLMVFGIVVYYVYKNIQKKRLVNKIGKMKIEQKVLIDLIKKTQEERFKENKISGLVYNIRIKKYQERQNEIKEELPVLEDRLKNTTKRLKKEVSIINYKRGNK